MTPEEIAGRLMAWSHDERLGDGMLLRKAAAALTALSTSLAQMTAERDDQRQIIHRLCRDMDEAEAALRAPTAPVVEPPCRPMCGLSGSTYKDAAGNERCNHCGHIRAPTAPPADLVALVQEWQAAERELDAARSVDDGVSPEIRAGYVRVGAARAALKAWTPPALGTPLAVEAATEGDSHECTQACDCRCVHCRG